ncbi:peptidase inhibitor family I36 protein [Nonomuraea sp. NPDC049695]|uniref:peptidase inhibitor family I36 protein n=1 Tax=Nonomuraea sp. NPDC049695 TaxID=3154734 RepID=UPI003415C2B4
MTRKLAVACSIGVLALSVGATPAMAGHDGSCGYAMEDGDVCLYRDSGFQGGMLDFTRTDKNYTSAADVFYAGHLTPTTVNINDQASSIINQEGYCEWWFYENAEFGGSGFVMYNIDPTFDSLGAYNDRLSSHYKWTGWTECTNGSTG